MSVIAKVSISSIAEFGTGRAVSLQCVASNDMMANYAGSEEDKLFSKASPSGEIKLHQPANFALGAEGDHHLTPAPQFYVMLLTPEETETDLNTDSAMHSGFPGAYAYCQGRCYSVTDYGYDSVRVEFRDQQWGTKHASRGKGRGVDKLNWKMSVDNPGASNQIKALQDYFIVFYPAANFDRDGAIRAAHGHPAPTISENSSS